MKKLSVVLATLNEEENIARCLISVKGIASEIIIFDEYSKDKTTEIAKRFGATVYKYKHKTNFHETKQKAIEKAKGDWILQLDADEVVTAELAKEIRHVINLPNDKLLHLDLQNTKEHKLFRLHQSLIEEREGKIGKDNGEVVAFFIPRLNMFLGKPLTRGGVYPDGVIRLIKRGKARLPGKSVHEQMEVEGQVAWLVNPLEHYDSPTFDRYIKRNNRYTDLIAKDYQKQKVKKDLLTGIYFTIYKPLFEFVNLFIRHKGILDGYRGFIWSFFSALRFPISYMKYLALKLYTL